ncbi:MAG TPA: FAD-binding oxidoreductase [Solirubrobacterales bacterium]|nr:FAD-binding oxidoreductase [Solirubrobacterales bacterium]
MNPGSTAARAPSLWLDPAPDPGPPLEGAIEADAVVIGAGYTGLWTALALRERGADVVVLERNYGGFGASGRNAGHLTPTIGKDLPTLLRLYGRERGGALVRFAEAAVEHVEAAISDRGIDCDYVAAGNVLAGVHPGQRPGLEKAAGAARQLGAAMRMLDPSGLAERGLPRFVACGYLEERGGVLHPGKYVRALRERAIEAGVRLHESTPVDAIADGPRVRVETPRGSASAPVCVVATNAYTPRLGRLRSAVAPLHVSLFATEPLTDEQRERVGWSGGEGVYTAHEVLESYRLTADGRIVGGSRHVRWSYGGRTLPDDDSEIFAALEAMFRARFPELADLAVERCWSGPIAMTLDFLPAIGRSGRHDNVLFGIGYNGHGVAQASYVGTLLAKMASGEDPGHPELLRRRRLPMPPEPLRSLWARGILGALRAVDRRTDRRALPRPDGFSGPVAGAPLDEEQAPAPPRRRRRSVV